MTTAQLCRGGFRARAMGAVGGRLSVTRRSLVGTVSRGCRGRRGSRRWACSALAPRWVRQERERAFLDGHGQPGSFVESDGENRLGVFGERDRVACGLAFDADLRSGAELDVGAVERDQLGDAEAGVEREREHRAAAPSRNVGSGRLRRRRRSALIAAAPANRLGTKKPPQSSIRRRTRRRDGCAA